MKRNETKFLLNCKEKDNLVLPNNKKISNIMQLADEIRLMDKDNFSLLINNTFFFSWIKNIIGDKKLYNKLKDKNKQEDIYKQIRIRLDYLYQIKKNIEVKQ